MSPLIAVSDALAWLGLRAMALAWLLLACGLAFPKPRPWLTAENNQFNN
jgi:hypothetical protein